MPDIKLHKNQTSSFVVVKYYLFLLPLIILFSLAACSQSEDQREFEREAFSEPSGFTATGDNGSVIEGREDPDDWRLSPLYRGFVDVFPPYPNPVLTNDRVTLEIFVTGVQGVDGLRVHVLRSLSTLSQPLFQEFQRPLPTGLQQISLNPLDIAEVRENPQGLYRIIVLDPQGNVITYGDIQID